jgi:hypothetical protein
MFLRIPRKQVADPLESADPTLGTTALRNSLRLGSTTPSLQITVFMALTSYRASYILDAHTASCCRLLYPIIKERCASRGNIPDLFFGGIRFKESYCFRGSLQSCLTNSGTTALFWAIKQRVVTIPYRRLGTTYCFHFQQSLDTRINIKESSYAVCSTFLFVRSPFRISIWKPAIVTRGSTLVPLSFSIQILQ